VNSELTALPLSTAEIPSRFPSPFDEIAPHPVAQMAAEHLMRSLERDDSAEGKVFGVLVVASLKVRSGTSRLSRASGASSGTSPASHHRCSTFRCVRGSMP
jgi:hypothetical protein